jgi:hypothetical protein
MANKRAVSCNHPAKSQRLTPTRDFEWCLHPVETPHSPRLTHDAWFTCCSHVAQTHSQGSHVARTHLRGSHVAHTWLTRGSHGTLAGPPHTNVTVAECFALCDAISSSSNCPFACVCVEFRSSETSARGQVDSAATTRGTCWRRAACDVPACDDTDASFVAWTSDARPGCKLPPPAPPPPSPPSPSPYPPPTPPPPPAVGKRNVLYIVYDDLRPDLSFYQTRARGGVGASMKTPNLQRLADTGTVFERAFTNIAVCAPSRLSFTTGRRPNSTRAWNFVNHWRQATCATESDVAYSGTAITGAGWVHANRNWGSTTSGGVAQCCTSCSGALGCEGWTYHNGNCTLFSAVTSSRPCPTDPGEAYDTCASGRRGTFEKWTPLPALFRERGFLTLGSGKYFHDGCAGLGAGDYTRPAGNGCPPMADAPNSWSNVAAQYPNITALRERLGTFSNTYGTLHSDGGYAYGSYLAPDDEVCGRDALDLSSDYCVAPGALPNGTTPASHKSGGDTEALADLVTYEDALAKLRFAAENLNATGQNFFQVVGIRRPHLGWRVPLGYTDLYPLDSVAAPLHTVLDKSVDPIAASVFPMSAPVNATGGRSGDFVQSPYVSGDDYQLRVLRQHYYAAVSWADFVAGRVLDELDALGLTSNTLVVMHSDHGWHLGEYGQWEKRTLWELGTRVPLVMRTPWIASSVGQRSRALVELVDVYQTVTDLVGVALPTDDSVPFDGTSLRPLLESPATAAVRLFALSTFPRCVHPGMPPYGARGTASDADNTCLDVERSSFTWMGYSIRTDDYRYTEWLPWNGSSLSPVRPIVPRAIELYNHTLDSGACTNPDEFENVNLAALSATPLPLIRELSEQLRAAFAL